MIRAGRRLAVAVVCAASALPVAPAAATAPTVELLAVDFTVVAGPGETLPTGGTNPCPFAIAFHNEGTFVFQTFSDRDGTAVRQLLRSARFTETYSANGRSLSTVSPAPARIDLTSGQISVSGNLRHLTVPGVGLVYAQAGHFVIDSNGNLVSFSGLDIPAGAEFCAALSA